MTDGNFAEHVFVKFPQERPCLTAKMTFDKCNVKLATITSVIDKSNVMLATKH